MIFLRWHDKRYNTLNYFFRDTFGEKVAKISLNAGFSCPNRDGTLSYEGCVFCGEGSGYYDELIGLSITEQFYEYKKRIDNKWANIKYIAYFQAYTNTYKDVESLRKIYYEAINIKDVVGISIATRPDCLSDEILELLAEIRKKTFVFVELGFQTSKEESVKLTNRLYDNKIYDDAVNNLNKIGINIITHVILGLPHETKEDMLNTIKYICRNPFHGVKLQLLHVVKNTKLCDMYKNKLFETLELNEYLDIVVSCLEVLPPEIVVHRINGDCPEEFLIAPKYCLNKRNILNGVDKLLVQRDSFQGKFFEKL